MERTNLVSDIGNKPLIFLLLLLPIATEIALSIELEGTSQPLSVQNGSSSRFIVDCPYELEQKDFKGFVVKWFYKNKPVPVYQWIPAEGGPQAVGRLKGRVDLEYETSPDEYKKHRALVLLDPTTDLNGRYSCWVSNFDQEKNMDVLFTVYSPASDFSVTYERNAPDSVLITCAAEGLFPEPKLALYRMMPITGTYQFEGEITESVFTYNNGTYVITLQKKFRNQDLDVENDFLCSLTIPNTEYQLDKKLSYFPAGNGNQMMSIDRSLLFLVLVSLLSGSLFSRS